jgi:Gametolysin peptidase M11
MVTQSARRRIPYGRSCLSSAQASHRTLRTQRLALWKRPSQFVAFAILLLTSFGACRVVSDTLATRILQRRSNGRLLQTQQEQRSLLILRILEAPENPVLTSEQHTKLQAVLFDGDVSASGPLPSVQEQMLLCSADRVRFVPLDVPNLADNVVEVVVDQALSDPSDYDEWVEVAAAIALDGPLHSLSPTSSFSSATAQLREVADHILVLLPESYVSSDTEFIATAEISNRISIYTVPWATSLSAYMHELAHNLGLRHSGDDQMRLGVGVEYGDTSGNMGQSVITPWAPQKCYNAAQHWKLGWYDETNSNGESLRVSLVDVGLPVQVSVAAFVDHKKLQNEQMVVLVQVESNIYLQFNRAKSYNVGTEPLFADKVVIVRDNGIDGTRLLASLGLDEQFTTPRGRTISVCQLVLTDVTLDAIDYATVGIQDGTAVGCDGPLVAGDPPPTLATPSAPLPVATLSPATSPTTSPIDSTPTTAPIKSTPTMQSSVFFTESPIAQATGAPARTTSTPVAVAVNPDDSNVVKSSSAPSAHPSVRSHVRGSLLPTISAPGSVSTDLQSSNGPAPSVVVLYTMSGLLVVAVVLLSMMLVVRRKRYCVENTHGSRSGESRSTKQSMSREIPVCRRPEADTHSGSRDNVTGAPTATTSSSQKKHAKVITPTTHNDESDDSDVEDSLSVVLEQEIWKERVNEILQTCWFTEANDGSTHMIPRR